MAAASAAAAHPTGVFVCQDARFTKNTTAGWPHVRAIRVLAGKGLTLRSSHSYIVHAGSEVTELGTVPLAADGSFAVEVPADTPIAFQAVDGEGRSELNEMSWIFVRPGETRGCVGCHQPRQTAPPVPLKGVQALQSQPLRLLGQGNPHRFRGNNAAVTGLMELQFDRYREVAGINRHSETADPLATGNQEVTTLISQLEKPAPHLRVSAAQRLAIFRQRSAAAPLARCLRDEQREVRVPPRWPSPPAAPSSPFRHWVSFFLARTLGNLGDPNSVAALLKVLEESAPEAAGGRPDPLARGCCFCTTT